MTQVSHMCQKSDEVTVKNHSIHSLKAWATQSGNEESGKGLSDFGKEMIR